MASVRSQIRGLVLSASELKELTGWPDAMVEDYLNILRNLITLAESVDNNNTDNVDITNGLIYGPVIGMDRHDAIAITADYTLPGEQTVICANTSPITVTLNATPDDYERATIKRTDAVVTIDGNGRNIDNRPALFINVKYTSLDLIYSVVNDRWNIL